MGRLSDVLIEVQDWIEKLLRSPRHKHTIESLADSLKEKFPSHNVRVWQDMNNAHLGKITFDGREIYKGRFK